MDGRPISVAVRIPSNSSSIISRIRHERVARSFRFLARARRPRPVKKEKRKKKRKSITIRWNSSVGANCPRQESSFAQRCAMKPYSPLRRPVFYRSECRFANVTVQMRTTTFCSFIVLSRLREKERERKKKERKEFDKIFESESFDSPDADLRDTGSRLLSLFERLVAVVT